MKRFLFVTAIMYFALIATNCAVQQQQQKAYLKKMPSNELLNNIKSYDDREVSYTFKSDLPEQFKYYKADIDLNASYASNLKHYMNNKYSVVDVAENSVEVLLQSCEYEAVQAGTETAHTRASSTTGHSASGTITIINLTVTTEINLLVRANVNGKVTEKQIMAGGENTGNYSSAETVQRSFDMAIERSLISVDKFLDKVFEAKK